MLKTGAVCIVLSSLLGVSEAEVITIEGTLTSVDATARTITVDVDGERRTLDVSRKVKVTVSGKGARLNRLRAGQKVKLSYHDDLEIVLRVNVGGDDQTLSLFNGRNLQGWQFHGNGRTQDHWKADSQRRVLICSGTDYNWIETDQRFADFTLHLEWRFVPGHQITRSGSGVVVRSTAPISDGNMPNGVEIQIGSGTSGDFFALETPLRTSEGNALGDKLIRLQKTSSAERPIGEWNQLVVQCEADEITVTLNGVTVNAATRAVTVPGRVCLLSQGSKTEFRNINLAPLSSGSVAK